MALAKEHGAILIKKIIAPPATLSHALAVNDQIIAVGQDGAKPVRTAGLSLARVVQMIRGTKGTAVRLTVVPAGQDASYARVVSFIRGELEALTQWGDGRLLSKGTPAPNVSFRPLSHGPTQHLADERGKVVILEFWATWCLPCQDEMWRLQELAAKAAWQGKVRVIAVDIDLHPDKAVRRLRQRGWNRTTNVWANRDVVRAFHVEGLPTTYVIDQRGRVAAASLGGIDDLSQIVDRLLKFPKHP